MKNDIKHANDVSERRKSFKTFDFSQLCSVKKCKTKKRASGAKSILHGLLNALNAQN